MNLHSINKAQTHTNSNRSFIHNQKSISIVNQSDENEHSEGPWAFIWKDNYLLKALD